MLDVELRRSAATVAGAEECIVGRSIRIRLHGPVVLG